jgi:ribonuclease HI
MGQLPDPLHRTFMNETPHLTDIKIWQQNTRRSLDAQLALINSLENKFDMVCIQEPHFDFRNVSRATGVWHTIYPTALSNNNERPRALMLIHEKISTNNWTQIQIDSLDVVAIKLSNETHSIEIYNIYNDCEHSLTIQTLSTHLAGNPFQNRLLLGDFNRHHPMWDEEQNGHLFTSANLNAAEELIDLIANNHLEMALPKYIPTLMNSAGNLTRPDNVFISQAISHWIVKCVTSPEDIPPKADHFPILTTLDFSIPEAAPKAAWNYRLTDWTKFRERLAENLLTIPPPQAFTTTDQMEAAIDSLTHAITETIEDVIPRKRPTPHSKRWWSAELSTIRTKTKRLARISYKYRRQPLHPCHEEYKSTRNTYGNLIKEQKKNHWVNWLEKIGEQDLWTANRFISAPPSDGGKARIPALKSTDAAGNLTEVRDNGDKSKLLHRVFFYNPPDDPGINPNQAYPDERFAFGRISNNHIEKAIKRLRPHKAPGINGIPNSILINCAELIVPYLGHIFRATFDLEHYPKQWKKYITVAVRKPGKADYTIANAYRPIALLDTMAKVLSSCVKDTLEYHTDRLQILPATQFGGRAGCTTTDSLHLLNHFIKNSWRKKHEVIGLFLDVKGAFPNAVIPCLIHDMRQEGVPKKATDWIIRQLEGRETVITFDDYTSESIPINNGFNQGDCLSTFFYRYYNAVQVRKITKSMQEDRSPDRLALNYADDAMCAASGPDLQQAAQKIIQMWKQPGGLAEWSQSHFSLYEHSKFIAISFTRKKVVDPSNSRKRVKQAPVEIQLEDHLKVKTTPSHKFLGVILDDELRFKQHADYALAKGTEWEARIRSIAKMARGAKGRFIKRLYYTVGLAKMLYAADIWCTSPIGRSKTTSKTPVHVTKMERVQRKIALRITGALRTTPSDLLLPHAGLIPLQLHIKKICQNSALRIATLPAHHPLCKTANKAATKAPKRHPSPLHIILSLLPTHPRSMETIDTLRKPPNWRQPLETIIPDSEEEALTLSNDNSDDIKLFTDGSGINGHIGAAAVLTRGFHPFIIARHYLGPETEHTVFEGECVGQLLGLNLLSRLSAALNIRTVTIAVDNQASISAHASTKPGPGSYLINRIHDTLQNVKQLHDRARIRIQWIPSHRGIPGSERADKEAKKAAEGAHRNLNNNDKILRRKLPISKSATKQLMRARLKREVAKIFHSSHRSAKMISIDQSMPATKFPLETAPFERRHVSILTQLRTSHIPLQSYLYRFRIEPHPVCPHCQVEPESVIHFLKYCPAYADARKELLSAIGRLTNLDTSILGNPRYHKPILKYAHRTQRFHDTHGNLNPPSNPTQNQRNT